MNQIFTDGSNIADAERKTIWTPSEGTMYSKLHRLGIHFLIFRFI
ncbi:hypothetical protein [Autumnicola musiva]|uniref:Uncharacterized protein n=1 Tax=Autumnicola musiva TaxID=3075589 RepID=A0ABU3D8N3_9FLAO|nr:hypothetical protein [Zunongwangia sp. F117]MDT0677892.1 hypothetical protein [Zunongwangia sp. F117]